MFPPWGWIMHYLLGSQRKFYRIWLSPQKKTRKGRKTGTGRFFFFFFNVPSTAHGHLDEPRIQNSFTPVINKIHQITIKFVWFAVTTSKTNHPPMSVGDDVADIFMVTLLGCWLWRYGCMHDDGTWILMMTLWVYWWCRYWGLIDDVVGVCMTMLLRCWWWRYGCIHDDVTGVSMMTLRLYSWWCYWGVDDNVMAVFMMTLLRCRCCRDGCFHDDVNGCWWWHHVCVHDDVT